MPLRGRSPATLFVGALLCAVLAAVSAQAQTGALDGATRSDWAHYGGTPLSWRYSALDQINTANVKQLMAAWIFQTGEYTENLQSTPIVVDGVMYIITPRNHVFALDAAAGTLLWEYKYPTPIAGPAGSMQFISNRGVAVGGGKVFFGTNDDYLVALDQKTGREVWKVNKDDVRQCGCDITAAPLLVKDKVLIGGTGGDAAHRGYLTAYYAKTGRLAWRWYAIPGPGEPGHETWKGDSWKTGGGSPWMTGSFDPELNLVFWGTGNAAGDFNDRDRSSGPDKSKYTNLYTASVVALDADTGKLRWYRQEVPDDVWDFDATFESILIDREVGGQMRKLLVHMNKSGLTFVLDRTNGDIVRIFSVPEVRNWITGVTDDGKLLGRKEPEEGKSVTICPSGGVGAKSWNSMAYSPRTGYIYAPMLELCNEVTSVPAEPVEGHFHANGNILLKLPPGRTTYSHLDAWDPVTGERAWSYPYKYVLLSSVLATAGDLVFAGTPEGEFFALDAHTGNKLWSYETGAGHRGSAISYSVNGRQYVAVTTGWQQSAAGEFVAGAFPDQTFRLGSTLVVFALPEGSK
jgi:alcohol dehydrogenase (cytochrome c)